MTTILYYARYSSSKQNDNSSVPRQITLCDQYRIKHSLPSPSYTYVDKGASAYHSRQLDKELGQLIRDLEEGVYKKPVIVLCEAIDRISRAGINESQDIFNQITKHADLITVSDEKKYSYGDNSLESSLIRLVKASLAHEESDKKAKRAKSYWDECRQNGLAQNSVCPRYLKLNKDRKTYSVIPEIAKEIQGMYHFLKSGYGITKVHQQYPSWSPSAITRLRKDERIVQYGIIEEVDFWKVQSTLKTTRKSGGKSSKNLFRSLFVCGECGATLVYVAPRPSRPTWSGHLICNSRQSKGRKACATSININYNKFEPIFLDLLTSISSDLFTTNRAEIEEKKLQLQEMEMRYSQTEQTYNSLVESFDSPSARMIKKIQELESALDTLEADKNSLLTEINGFSEVELEIPTTDCEREDFNTKLLHSFKKPIIVSYPTDDNNWYTFDNKFEISGDFTRWELIHEDIQELPITLEFE